METSTVPTGVFPLKRKSRTWKVNKYTGIEARRTGFCMLPDFGSTAHMIQGATLEAAFVDLQDPSCKASMTYLIAAYVCLSRVKRLQNICVMQPFSPFLFRQGPPKGPSRLLRLWKKECTFENMSKEWEDDSDSEDETGSADKAQDLMKRKHICTSCYFQGSEIYKHSVREFGISSRVEFWSKYVSQGAWTRCVKCVHRYGPIQCSTNAKLTDNGRVSHGDTMATAGGLRSQKSGQTARQRDG